MASRKPRPLYMAIDFGSSHIRAAVGPATGQPLSIVRIPVKYTRPEDGPDTALEFSPETAWKSVGEASKKALRDAGIAGDQVRSVAVTSQRLGLVMYGHDGKELYSGPNRDMRGVFQGGQIDADAGNMLWQMTGHGPAMLTAWARMLWLKQERPESYENLRTVSGLADWLAFRMTGILLMESALACESGLGLVATGAPATGLASYAGLDEIDLPPTCPSGSVVGKLVTTVARAMGLSPGTPVIAAGPDSQVGLAGLGVSEPETSGVIAGWSAAVQRVTNLPLFDSTHAMWTGRHVLPGAWTVEGNAGEMGGAYHWLVSLICQGEDPEKAMERLDRQAARIEPGANGAAGYLGPSFTHMSNIGMRSGGIFFPVPLSFEPPDRATLARAALENFAFAIRYNADRLAMFGGPSFWFAAGGGMTRSRTFRNILTSVLGGAVGFSRSGESTILGALSIAASGAGDGEIFDLTERRRHELRVQTAESAIGAEYDDLYHAWRARERMLTDIEL
ncbi:MAG: FGGY family carbohydrate kinase [Chloroflexi bacterium]|nr:FGGY family carbohydrate kinase [Chloroflexota bacterium]